MQLKSTLSSAENLSTCTIENPKTQETQKPKTSTRKGVRELREKFQPNITNQEQLEKIKEQLEILLKSSSTVPPRSVTRTNQFTSK